MRNDNSENLLQDLVDSLELKIKKAIDGSLPCVITKVESRSRVTVRPLINIIDKSGKSYERDLIEGLPVEIIGAGDVFVSCPVSVGSLGWIVASDRDISLFLQSYQASKPPTKRMHSFSDARFVPDIMTDFTIAEEDSTAIVIQNRSGSVKIALDQDEIRVRNNDASVVMGIDSIDISTSSVQIGITGDSVNGVAPGGFNLNGFTINAIGAAESPVSVTAPTVAAGTGMTIAGVAVADSEHDHNSGTLQDSMSGSVSGKTAQSNG